MYKLCVALAFLAVAAAKPSWPLGYNAAFGYPAEYPYPYFGSGFGYSAPLLPWSIATPVLTKSIAEPVATSTATPVVAKTEEVAPTVVSKSAAAPVDDKSVVAPVVAKTEAPVVSEFHSTPLVDYSAFASPLFKSYPTPISSFPSVYPTGFGPFSAYSDIAPASFLLKK